VISRAAWALDAVKDRPAAPLPADDREIPGPLSGILDSTQTTRLENWVRSGGTLIAMESAALFFTKEASGLTGIEPVPEEHGDEEAPPSDPYTGYEERADARVLSRIPGAALAASVDTTHPLGYGMPRQFFSLKTSTNGFKPARDYDLVAYYDEDPENVLVSGYASQENISRLAGTSFTAVARSGRGRYVLMLDDTQYRMFWLGPMRKMQNAVMLLPGM
jgi:hypothetical protein